MTKHPTAASLAHPAIWLRGLLALALAAMLLMPMAQATSPTSWTATWTASPQPVWDPEFEFPTQLPDALKQQTLRQVVRVSLGGERLRIVLSNAYGDTPLAIGKAYVALAGNDGNTIAGSGHALTFGGSGTAVVPPGAPLVSDPIDMAIQPLSRLAISIYLPLPSHPAGFHWDGRQTAYIGAGDQADAEQFKADSTTTARLFLGGVYVDALGTQGAVAVLGDSITDGNGATLDADARWPDFLAERLAPRKVAVINAGISGARLLSDKMGVNALARFQRDVLSQPGVKSVIVLLGINDIGWPGTPLAPDTQPPTPAAMIAGYRQLIAMAHLHGVRIIGATLMPFEGALQDTPLGGYYKPQKEALRQEINTWIRNSGEFDAVRDFDALARDPEQPSQLGPEFDSSDHLHPGDSGNKAMAQAVDLDTLF